MKKQNLLFVCCVAQMVFAALMLIACDSGTVVMVPGPGIPVAKATANPITGDSPLTVTLSSGSSTDPDGEIVRWQWDFENDGTYDWSSTTTGSVTYEYPAGEYTAKLLVTDDTGKTATAKVENIFSNPAHLYWTFETVASFDEPGYSPGYSFVFINPVTRMPCVVYGIYFDRVYKGLGYASRDDSGNWHSDEYDLPLNQFTEPVVFSDGSFGLGVYTTEVSGNIGFLERSAAGVWSLNRIDTDSSMLPIHLASGTSGEIYVMYYLGAASYNIAVNSGSVWTVNEASNKINALPGPKAFTCFEGDLYAAFLEGGNTLAVYGNNQGNWQVDTRIDLNGRFHSAELLNNAGTLMLFETEILPNRLTYWRKSSNEWAMTDLTGIIPADALPRSGLYQLHAFKNGSAVSLAFTTSFPRWVCYVADIANPSMERFAYDSLPESVHAVYGDDNKVYLCYTGLKNKEVILATKK